VTLIKKNKFAKFPLFFFDLCIFVVSCGPNRVRVKQKVGIAVVGPFAFLYIDKGGREKDNKGHGVMTKSSSRKSVEVLL
jgi:hypothetical protein